MNDNSRSTGPLAALARAARPLSGLGPLEHMIGAAEIVGVGEATHSSREFFALKHRIFRHLVEQQGFTTFALEAGWSAGMRLNAHVLHGTGDPRRIMREEFQNAYLLWNTREYLDLIRWMREHNLRLPQHPVQFMGNDCCYAGPELFDTVMAYAAEWWPDLLPELRRRYQASRPTGSVDAWMKAYVARPLAERRAMADDVRQAWQLLEQRAPQEHADNDENAERTEHAEHTAHTAHAWTVQHARVIAQVGEIYAYDYADPSQLGQIMLHRDRVMAENTVWWQRRTGHRMVLSAHNGHVAYETADPVHYPKLQGAFLRELMGEAYVSAGFSFGQGSFNAFDTTDPAEPVRTFSVGPPEAGGNEETLERVSPRDYCLDMRTAPPAAREWLGVHRPTRSIDAGWPIKTERVRLLTSYDLLIHLHQVHAADRL